MTELYQIATKDNGLWGWDICMFGFGFMSHTEDGRDIGILVVKGFGVLHDCFLDFEFFMWPVRIQTEQKPKKRISKRDACYDCASPGQRHRESEGLRDWERERDW